MTLRHLEILKTVAETGNFTKAAERLFITQSAVSHAMRELEEQAQTVLFERMNKCVRITESGRMLLEEALPLLSSFEALEARMGRLEEQAPIRIASCITIAAFKLPDIMTRFEKLWPCLPVEVSVQSAASSLDILRSGNADLALIEGSSPVGPYVCAPFSSYGLSLVCSPGFYADHRPCTLSDICSLPLLLREPGSAIRETFDSALYLQGYEPHPLWVSMNSTALLEAAKAGLGVTILPDILVKEALSDGTLLLLSIDGLHLTNQMMAVHYTEKHITAPFRDLLALFSQ